MIEMTPETLPTMPYSEGSRTCAKACMAVLPPNDAMYQWLQIYLEHTAALQSHIEALECPDKGTARALSELIKANRVPSPWRDGGRKLRAFGEWLAALAKEKP